MPYVSRELLRLALDDLNRNYSPLVSVSLPCMLDRDIPTCETAAEAQERAIPFGAPDERAWLDSFFRVPGGPPGKPYFIPGTGEWVQERYPDRSLQRRRTDFQDSVFFHPNTRDWALRPEAAEVLRERVIQDLPPLKLASLMTWMWREREIDSVHRALDEFIAEIRFDRDGLLGSVYDPELPEEFAAAGLGDTPVSLQEVAELTGAVPPPPKAPPLGEAVSEIEDLLRRKRFIAPPGLVERIIGGWLVHDIVVLVGPTGSGKTTLARLLSQGLTDIFGEERFFSAFLEVTPDYDMARFLGYENLAGEYTAGQFAEEVLFLGSPSDPRLVVLDEWNLAQIDSYLAPILSGMESGMALHLPGRVNLDKRSEEERRELIRAQPDIEAGKWQLPEDTFFVATCNSWLDEPETRLPISGPVKRRSRIIPMPNALAVRLEVEGRGGLVDFCTTLLDQERIRVGERHSEGRQSVLDRHRMDRLRAVTTVEDLSEESRDSLLQISQMLLENPTTRPTFTPGILRDLLLTCVYAAPDDQYAALGQEVADKVLHQIQGDPQILRVLYDETRDFPNAKEIEDLVTRMGGLGGERRIRPLV